jgi:hypothetical protein
MILLAGALGLPVLAGVILMRRAIGSGDGRLPLAAGLGAGLGLGLSAAVFCVWRFVVDDLRPRTFHVLEVVLWALVCVAAWRVSSSRGNGEARARDGVDWWVAAAFAIVAGLSLTYFVVRTIVAPHGDWDAWAIWNLKARFMLRGGASWTNLFSSAITQHDYPLLLPAAIARLWSWTGNVTTEASAAVAAVFTYAIPVVVTGTLARLRGWTPAVWGGALTIAAWPLSVYGTAQMADVPLGFFLLASVVLVVLDTTSDAGVLLTVLAGVAAGLMGLVKNEGAPFMIIVAVAYAAFWIGRRACAPRRRLRHLAAWAGGACPFWALLAVMKAHSASGGLAIALTDEHAAGKILDLARHEQILRAFVSTIWIWGGSFPVGAVPLFGLVLLVGGWRIGTRQRAAVGFSAVMVAGALASFYAAYVLSPYDLTWHLATSLPRILVQVWPTFALAFCLVARLEDGEGTIRSIARRLMSRRARPH